MHKALIGIINGIARDGSFFIGSSETQAHRIQMHIRRQLKAQRLSRVISFRDIQWAALMAIKRNQEAESNMVQWRTRDNYYAKVTCKYYKVER